MQIDICGSHYNIHGDFIEAIVLFGSKARGDDDSISDIDIFILINDCSEEELILHKKEIVNTLHVPADWISVYRQSSVTAMHNYGSYFLWHIKREGKILFSKNQFLEQILDSLPAYSGVEEDLKDYLVICQDIEKSISLDENTLLFEMATLASLARNTCIAVSYKKGRMVFGRLDPVIEAKKIFGNEFPFSINDYVVLYKYRLARIRSTSLIADYNMKPSIDDVKIWIERIKKLINLALDICTKESE